MVLDTTFQFSGALVGRRMLWQHLPMLAWSLIRAQLGLETVPSWFRVAQDHHEHLGTVFSVSNWLACSQQWPARCSSSGMLPWFMWPWIDRRMNIHLPAILMFTRCTGFWSVLSHPQGLRMIEKSEVFQSNTSQRLGSSAKGTMVRLPSWLSEAAFDSFRQGIGSGGCSQVLPHVATFSEGWRWYSYVLYSSDMFRLIQHIVKIQPPLAVSRRPCAKVSIFFSSRSVKPTWKSMARRQMLRKGHSTKVFALGFSLWIHSCCGILSCRCCSCCSILLRWIIGFVFHVLWLWDCVQDFDEWVQACSFVNLTTENFLS